MYANPYIYTSDPWGDTTGIRAFLPGIDIVDFRETGQTPTTLLCDFTLTNMAILQGKLLYNDGSVDSMMVLDTTLMDAGKYTISLDKFNFKDNANNYSLKLTAKSAYNSEYIHASPAYECRITKEIKLKTGSN